MRYRWSWKGDHKLKLLNSLPETFLRQHWQNLLFLHWEYSVDAIQTVLPKGLEVDTFQGKAYVGIIPFQMKNLRVRGLPAVGGISNFLELNLRTYVKDRNQRSGVWFFSLEADSSVSVAIANRLFSLPYRRSKLSFSDAGDELQFGAVAKRDSENERMNYRFKIGKKIGRAQRRSLEEFLIERYRLFTYSKKQNRILTGTIHHDPYSYSLVEDVDYSTRLFELNGLTKPQADPVSALYIESVDVSLNRLHAVNE